jgi:hypothetical protein
MLVVETIARIRREHFGRGKGIEAIARDLRVSRKVVRKVLRSGATEFPYERREQPHPQLGRFIGRLEALLAENAARPRRERLTLKRLFDLLRREGYAGGYDAVRRFAGRWRREQRGAGGAALVPLVFPPGRLPFRLIPRAGRARRACDDGQGRPHPALPQPRVLPARLSAKARRWCSSPRSSLHLLRRDQPARDL